jgi:hypothetical protein
MTDHTSPNPPFRPTSLGNPGHRRRSLYRTVLSLAIAALVAAWLPFSVLYVTALNKRSTPMTAISTPHSTGRTARMVTTTSGAKQLVAGNGSTAGTAITPSPITTRDP